MTNDSIYPIIMNWEFSSMHFGCIFPQSIPTYDSRLICPLFHKDRIEIPIPITGNIRGNMPSNIAHSITTFRFNKDIKIHKYLKNYKKLIENFFIYSNRFSYYSTDQFPENYFIGRGILADDKGKILCLVTREYSIHKDSDDVITYNFTKNLNSVESLIFYISPRLISNPKNNFEKAFVKNIYDNALNWDSIKIVINSNINKLFLLDNTNIDSRIKLKAILNTIAESSERIINSLEDYEH